MNYRISYYSPQGHAKELAYAFRQILLFAVSAVHTDEKRRIQAVH